MRDYSKTFCGLRPDSPLLARLMAEIAPDAPPGAMRYPVWRAPALPLPLRFQHFDYVHT